MLGWEGRFEPVECVGKKVLLEPLHDLEPEDRFVLLVTLADGTELPFTVTGSATRRDMQVDLYPRRTDCLLRSHARKTNCSAPKFAA